MARINLLPWRQEERERKNKDFILRAVLTAILTTLVLGFITFLYAQDLQNQLDANVNIEQENTRLDGLLTEIAAIEEQRTQMIEQMQVVQGLQGNRPVPVRLWDDFARAITDGMYLTSFARQGDTLIIHGYAENPNVVAAFVRRLDASPWIQGAMPRVLQTNAQAYSELPAAPTNRPFYPEDNYIQFEIVALMQNGDAQQVLLDENGNPVVPLPPMNAGMMPSPQMDPNATIAPVADAPANAAVAQGEVVTPDSNAAPPTPVIPEQMPAPTGGEPLVPVEDPNLVAAPTAQTGV